MMLAEKQNHAKFMHTCLAQVIKLSEFRYRYIDILQPSEILHRRVDVSQFVINIYIAKFPFATLVTALIFRLHCAKIIIDPTGMESFAKEPKLAT